MTIGVPFSLLPEATFPERLRKARLALGLTQKGLSRAAGLSKDLVYRWERGLHGPRAASLRRVAAVLGVEAEYLVGGRRELAARAA